MKDSRKYTLTQTCGELIILSDILQSRAGDKGRSTCEQELKDEEHVTPHSLCSHYYPVFSKIFYL